MSYGNWKHILGVFSFQNSVSNDILVIKHTLRDPLVRGQPQLLRIFFSSLGSMSLGLLFFFFSHDFISKTNIIPTFENATSTFKPKTYGINKNPIKKVTNPQSIRANEIPNIKDADPVSIIYTTTTSVDDCLDADVVANLVVVIGAGGDCRISRTRADSSWKTLDCWSWCCLLIVAVWCLIFFSLWVWWLWWWDGGHGGGLVSFVCLWVWLWLWVAVKMEVL